MVSTKRSVPGFVIFLSFALSLATAFAGESRTVQVFPNIYTVTGGSGQGANSTFIITSKGVIVIDTRNSPAAAENVLAEIRKRTKLPIRFTINTSFKGDHIFGNQVFKKSSPILAHKNVGKFLLGKNGQGQLNRYKIAGVPGADKITLTFPNLVYEKNMQLVLGGYFLDLKHFGRGCTIGDTVVYLPTFRAIITGDIVVNKEIPSMEYAFIEDWIQVLFEIEKLNVEIVIPGHGDVTEKPTVILMRQYLRALKSQVIKQLQMGKTLKETQDAVRPILQGKYGNWARQDRLDRNIRRAYWEFTSKKQSDSKPQIRIH
ncbi:MAG: MBL fold metallo-hydrolase [Nitrospinales bacterium]